MFKLDRAYLESLGLGDLAPDDMNELLAAVYEELEMRVGYICAERMSDTQLNEFEDAIDSEDEDAALSVLERCVPDYKVFVDQQLTKVTDELRGCVPNIRERLGLTRSAPAPVRG